MLKQNKPLNAKYFRTIAPVRIYGHSSADKMKGSTSYEMGGSLPAKDALAATTGHSGFEEKYRALVGGPL